MTAVMLDVRTGEYLPMDPGPIEQPPPEPTPGEIRALMPTLTARQLRLAMLTRLDEVEGIIEASGDRAMQIEWEYATTFERLHPAIIGIGAALGLTPEEIDTLWLDAANT